MDKKCPVCKSRYIIINGVKTCGNQNCGKDLDTITTLLNAGFSNDKKAKKKKKKMGIIDL